MPLGAALTLTIGGAVLAAGWMGPLPELASGSFAAHMTLHMLVVGVAAPILAAGLTGHRADPVRLAPSLFVAIPASLVELVTVWAWHAPALHHAARHDAAAFIAEQASFLVAGTYLWCSVLGGDTRARRERTAPGIVALLLTFAHMTLLGALLALTPRPLYEHGAVVSALADQQLGGAIMLVASAVVYIGGGLWLSRGLVAGHAQTSRS